MTIQRVQRLALDGSTVTITFGRHEVRCTKVSYGDKLEKSTLSNMGSQEIDAATLGTYKVDDAKVSIEAIEFRTVLYPILQSNGFGNERINVVVTYGHPDIGYDSDMLGWCSFIAPAASMANDNKPAEVEITLQPLQVYWGSERKTINRVGAAVPLTSKF